MGIYVQKFRKIWIPRVNFDKFPNIPIMFRAIDMSFFDFKKRGVSSAG
jgi:hypothetical protein